MRLGVVVPLANEEATVGEFLGRVTRQLTAADAVFCVVDNASRDRTREAVEADRGTEQGPGPRESDGANRQTLSL